MRSIQREVIHERLCELNISWETFKEEVAVDRRTLERLLSGKTRRPHPATVSKISQYLGLSPSYLIIEPYGVQKFSDSNSPFVAGTPVTSPNRFFGRQNTIDRLIRLWHTIPMQNAAIIGNTATGKTSLFHYFIALSNTANKPIALDGCHLSNCRALNGLSFLYISLLDPGLQSPEAIHHRMLSLFDNDGTNVDTEECFYSQAVNMSVRKKTVIFIDDIDSAFYDKKLMDNSFWEGLRYLASHNATHLAFVIGCKQSPYDYSDQFGLSSPFFNIFGYTTTLGKFDEDEAFSLIESSPVSFTESDKEWILENSHCYPRLLQILCWERLASWEEDQRKSCWRIEAYERIKHLPELNN